MEVTTEVGLHGESSQTGRVRFFMCILLSRALLTLACSGICISLFFGLLFIWRLRRPLIGRARSLILTWTRLRFRILNSAQYRECQLEIIIERDYCCAWRHGIWNTKFGKFLFLYIFVFISDSYQILIIIRSWRNGFPTNFTSFIMGTTYVFTTPRTNRILLRHQDRNCT